MNRVSVGITKEKYLSYQGERIVLKHKINNLKHNYLKYLLHKIKSLMKNQKLLLLRDIKSFFFPDFIIAFM